MIEVIYKDEKPEEMGGEGDFSVPKNIRQIGTAGDNCRIYMEDYVYTFLTRRAEAEKENAEEKSSLAVLVGETRWASGIAYIFVKGAIAGEAEELSSEHIEFTDSLWKQIHGDMELFFQGQEIVGWFFAEKSLAMEPGEIFCQVHRKHFGGEKVLMLLEPGEREEAFFRYENNFLVRQSGYYLYYEKNPQMQAYMVEKNPDFGQRREEVPDEAVKTFRKIIQKKNTEEKETEESNEKTSVFSYAATACLALAVIAAGTRFYQNYQAMQMVNEKTEMVSAVIEQEEAVDSMDGSKQRAEEGKGSETEDGAGIKEKETSEITEMPKEAETEKKKDTVRDKSDAENLQEKENRVKEAANRDEEDAAIYKQESDVRKAERRVREAHKNQNENQQQDTGIKDAGTEETGHTEATAAETGHSYIIRPGDTLYQISVEQYGTMEAVSEICRMNEIQEDEIIYPGQIIVLP